MPARYYRIKLSQDERLELENIRDRGSEKAKTFKKVLALLLCDEGPGGPALKDPEICRTVGISASTLERLRQRGCEVGPLGALVAKAREKPAREIKITGEVEARITQLACSAPPEGCSRWTLRLLADRLVEIEVIESISHTAVGLVLKKVRSSHGDRNAGASRRKRTPRS
jgi:hypothetical protein